MCQLATNCFITFFFLLFLVSLSWLLLCGDFLFRLAFYALCQRRRFLTEKLTFMTGKVVLLWVYYLPEASCVVVAACFLLLFFDPFLLFLSFSGIFFLLSFLGSSASSTFSADYFAANGLKNVLTWQWQCMHNLPALSLSSSAVVSVSSFTSFSEVVVVSSKKKGIAVSFDISKALWCRIQNECLIDYRWNLGALLLYD